MVQDAASKKSNNLLLDTSDLAISQYSLLGPSPPRSAPDSPAVGARDSSSAAPSEDKEPAPAVEEGGQMVTGDVCPHDDPERTAIAKSDHSATQSSEHVTALVSPVIVVTQQFDESSTEEASCFKETLEVLPGTDTESTMDSATADTANTATPDSDAAGTHEVGTPDAPANPESPNPIPDSPNLSASTLSSLQSTDVLAESAQSDQSATPESPATPDVLTSDEVETDDAASVQHPCISSPLPPCADSPMKISLGSLSEAISCDSAAPSITQDMAQRTTDRAVYLTGEIKDNWEVERVEQERQKEAVEEKKVHERIEEGSEVTGTGEGKEEEVEGERGEGQMGCVAQTGGEPVDEGRRSSEFPAETREQRESEEKVDEGEKGSELEAEKRGEGEEEPDEKGDDAEKEGKKEEEVLQSIQPNELQPESVDELPLDSVAVIRDLVIEVIEVETEISPCPTSSHAP